jgi:hypothetical protein
MGEDKEHRVDRSREEQGSVLNYLLSYEPGSVLLTED